MNEDAELAQRLLAGLSQPEGPDYAPLLALIQPWLEPAAARYHGQYNLGDRCSPLDLIQGFLAWRIFDRCRLRALMEPIATGVPLRPWLMASFRNYCVDESRRPHARSQVEMPDLPAATLPTWMAWPTLADFFAAQQDEVRATHATVTARVPYRVALLLDLRVQASSLCFGSLATNPDGTDTPLTLGLLERLMPWEEAEMGEPLVSGGRSLAQMWQGCRELLVAEREARPKPVAALVPVPHARWLQWLCRGRESVRQRVGEERFAELYPNWPIVGRTPA